MKLRIILKWILIIVSSLAITFSLIIILINITQVKQDSIYIKPVDLIKTIVDVNKPNIELPIRIEIPQIGVSAAVEYVGLNLLGAMDVPAGPDNVGWFDLGVRPGEIGSAVMAGHYGWKNNIPAIFDNLSKLKIGDKIYTLDSVGATTTFIVREIGIYKSDGDAANVFGSSDGLSHLNLITCEGIWNATKKTRPSRLVIFTDKE